MKIVKPKFEIISLYSAEKALEHIERCGRICYHSENKTTYNSANLFVGTFALRHESLLRHVSVTVKITCDIKISLCDVRHDLMQINDDGIINTTEWMPGISQESTRFCNYSKGKFGGEITFIDNTKHWKSPKAIQIWLTACENAENNYLSLIALGESPEMARSVLTLGVKTDTVITANLQEWRNYLKTRASGTTGRPHPQQLEITIPLLEEFKKTIPIVFDDILPNVD
jgi:thymidylate synthase (FAD)